MARYPIVVSTKIRSEDQAVVSAVAALLGVSPGQVMRDAIVSATRARLRQIATDNVTPAPLNDSSKAA
jgi:hypothetical protein